MLADIFFQHREPIFFPGANANHFIHEGHSVAPHLNNELPTSSHPYMYVCIYVHIFIYPAVNAEDLSRGSLCCFAFLQWLCTHIYIYRYI